MKLIKNIRVDFPPVRKYKSNNEFVYIVDCRSKKYGMTNRFKRRSECKAIELHNTIKSKVVSFGIKSNECEVAKNEINLKHILDKIAPFGVDIETIVNIFIQSKGKEITDSIKPLISELVDEFYNYKTLNILEPIAQKTKREVQHYTLVIKRNWGNLRLDDVNNKMVKDFISNLDVQNSTRRKYKIYISMFFGINSFSGFRSCRFLNHDNTSSSSNGRRQPVFESG